jgi:hypothetical protein
MSELLFAHTAAPSIVSSYPSLYTTYMIPKVDTFAQDISQEVKTKEASLVQIVGASNDVKNTEPEPNNNKTILIAGILSLFFIISIVAVIVITLSKEEAIPLATEIEQKTKENKSLLPTISPTLEREIGIHIQSIEKKDKGYVLVLTSYAPVFAYMKRNESDYIIELGKALQKDVASSTRKSVETKTGLISTLPNTSTTTQVASSTTLTIQAGSTTSATNETASLPELSSPWSDVTLSNTTMRIFKEGDYHVVYSFVSPTQLIIAPNETSLLAIKSVILR